MEGQSNRLDLVVQHLGETVLATTESIESLAERVDDLANQVQQQSYQIFALGNAMQTLAENQDYTLARLAQLTETLQRMAASVTASLQEESTQEL